MGNEISGYGVDYRYLYPQDANKLPSGQPEKVRTNNNTKIFDGTTNPNKDFSSGNIDTFSRSNAASTEKVPSKENNPNKRPTISSNTVNKTEPKSGFSFADALAKNKDAIKKAGEGHYTELHGSISDDAINAAKTDNWNKGLEGGAGIAVANGDNDEIKRNGESKSQLTGTDKGVEGLRADLTKKDSEVCKALDTQIKENGKLDEEASNYVKAALGDLIIKDGIIFMPPTDKQVEDAKKQGLKEVPYSVLDKNSDLYKYAKAAGLVDKQKPTISTNATNNSATTNGSNNTQTVNGSQASNNTNPANSSVSKEEKQKQNVKDYIENNGNPTQQQRIVRDLSLDFKGKDKSTIKKELMDTYKLDEQNADKLSNDIYNDLQNIEKEKKHLDITLGENGSINFGTGMNQEIFNQRFEGMKDPEEIKQKVKDAYGEDTFNDSQLYRIVSDIIEHNTNQNIDFPERNSANFYDSFEGMKEPEAIKQKVKNMYGENRFNEGQLYSIVANIIEENHNIESRRRMEKLFPDR